jgi:hypothetical protein
MIIKTISSYAFHDEFQSIDSRRDTFSYNAREALFKYLDNLSDETETPIELDIVAICCDYTEYESAFEAVDAYTEDCPYLLDEDELLESDGTSIDTVTLMEKQNEKALEYLNDNTQVIEFAGGILIQNF